MPPRIWKVALCVAMLGVGSMASATAQTWPQRPVKFILPLGAGAGADVSARIFADRLSMLWGKPVVVENRPGGDGFVAITAVLTARDDHTLLFSPASTFTAHPFLHTKLPYDPREIVPIAKVSNTLIAIAVPASMGINSMSEMVARAQAEPGKLNWAAVTGSTELAFAGFLKRTGITMAKVPYRDTVSALNDLGESRIHAFMAAYAIVRAQAEAGRVKVLAMTNRLRAPMAPDIPTVREAGYPALDFDGLAGLYTFPGMSMQVRERIADDIREIGKDPAIAARLTGAGQALSTGTSAEFAAEIEEQRAAVAAIAKDLGINAAQ